MYGPSDAAYKSYANFLCPNDLHIIIIMFIL